MPSRPLGYIIIGITYIVLSLLIGEVHPFTVVPMYSSFPNWAYSFYLSDSTSRLLPIANYFKYADDELGHNYAAICEQQKIVYGNQTETKIQLECVGKQMFGLLQAHQVAPLLQSYIQLHRVCYFMQRDSINVADIIIYEGKWNE